MKITTIELHDLMHSFFNKNLRLPNTILLPAADRIFEYDLPQLERILCVQFVYAAVTHPQAAIL